MQTRRLVPRLAVLITAFIAGALVLQPMTLHAESTQGVTLTSDEPPSSVAPNVAPEVYQGSFKYTTTADMLAALHVTVYPEDVVDAFPDPSLGIGSQIRVYRAHPITIIDAGQSRLVRTWAATVGDLAAEQRLNLAEQDTTSAPLTAKVADLSQLVITRVSVATIQTTQPIPYTTTYTSDPSMEMDVQHVKQTGQNGVLQQTYIVTRKNGVEVSRVLSGSAVLQAPVDQIIAKGTEILNYGSGGASWYASNLPPLTAANKTLPKGTKVNVVNLANGKSVTVTIDDRGPYVGGRVIDLSPDAFAQIASLSTGVIQVRMDKVYN